MGEGPPKSPDRRAWADHEVGLDAARGVAGAVVQRHHRLGHRCGGTPAEEPGARGQGRVGLHGQQRAQRVTPVGDRIGPEAADRDRAARGSQLVVGGDCLIHAGSGWRIRVKKG